MWQVDKICAIARAEIGTREQPADSNRQKYGEAYGWNGVPWCVQFIWWLFVQAGLSALFYGGQKTASCGELLRWAREMRQLVGVENVARGDVVFLSFTRGSEPEHLGMVYRESYPDAIYTVEGNTSAAGSQDNGGMVLDKLRRRDHVVAVWRPNYAAITDYTGRWSEPAIRQVIDRGIMTGDPDGSFRPRDPVTREELAAVAARILEVIDRE